MVKKISRHQCITILFVFTAAMFVYDYVHMKWYKLIIDQTFASYCEYEDELTC